MKLNQKGISLVQVLIASAVMGGLAVVSMQMFSNMTQGQMGIDSFSDELSLRTQIETIIRNPDYCRVSFAGDGPEGSPLTPVTFNKVDIDEANEGLDVELFLSDQDGEARLTKKFSSDASDPSTHVYGKVKINSMVLRMDNGTGSNYSAEASHTDLGNLEVIIEKKVSPTKTREKRLSFPVELVMSTDGAGLTTILGCQNGSASASGPAGPGFLVLHSQSSTVPSCPAGWNDEWEGYSLIAMGGGDSSSAIVDLGEPASCMENFRKVMFVECEGNICDYHTGNDYTFWLSIGNLSFSTASDAIAASRTSRCRVCSGSAKVFARHSQTTTKPSCPSGYTELWEGYSFAFAIGGGGYNGGSELSSSGSCLPSVYPTPFIECQLGNCRGRTPGDYSFWLSAYNGPDVPATSSPALYRSRISRCAVCSSN